MPNTKESKRHDVKIKELVAWNQFETASAAEALPKIYEHAAQFSGQNRDWYWKSIASKRP